MNFFKVKVIPRFHRNRPGIFEFYKNSATQRWDSLTRWCAAHLEEWRFLNGAGWGGFSPRLLSREEWQCQGRIAFQEIAASRLVPLLAMTVRYNVIANEVKQSHETSTGAGWGRFSPRLLSREEWHFSSSVTLARKGESLLRFGSATTRGFSASQLIMLLGITFSLFCTKQKKRFGFMPKRFFLLHLSDYFSFLRRSVLTVSPTCNPNSADWPPLTSNTICGRCGG